MPFCMKSRKLKVYSLQDIRHRGQPQANVMGPASVVYKVAGSVSAWGARMKAQIASPVAVALTLIAVPVGPARANDSTAANNSTAGLAAGGLVLTKSADIEMKSEDLYISEKLVRVRYSFVNTSPKDLTVTVAFPLPDIDANGHDDNMDVPVESATNFLGFTTMVDGKLVKMQVEQKALVDGVDCTAVLLKHHVPLAP